MQFHTSVDISRAETSRSICIAHWSAVPADLSGGFTA